MLADGTVHGWLGGACAEPTVVREALASLGRRRAAAAVPRARPTSSPPTTLDGHVTVPMACESEGALEVYIEPFLPAPQLVVVGRSPAVHALDVQARALEWDVAVIDDGGDADEHPHPELVRTTLDFAGLGIGPSTAIVVATQGHYDDLALRAALATDAGYIGVVAAEKRASSLRRSCCATRGIDDEQLARVHAPAGLDLGAVDNAEIAVAVLADLVARRAAGQLRGAAHADVRARRDRPGVRHDRVRRRRQVPHRARRHRLLVLLRRLSTPVRPPLERTCVSRGGYTPFVDAGWMVRRRVRPSPSAGDRGAGAVRSS